MNADRGIVKCLTCSMDARIAAILFALITPSHWANAATVPAAQHEPLASRVQKIFGIRLGRAEYLPSFARLVQALGRYAYQPREKQEAVFAAHSEDVRQIVAALNAGANPTALRDRILACVNVEGQCRPKGGGKWKYGNTYDRLLVSALLARRALALEAASRRQDATRYARASSLLACQEDVLLGSRFPLYMWVKTSWPAYLKKLVPDAGKRRAMDAENRAIRAMLAVTASGRHRLTELYDAAIRRAGGRFGKAFNAFCDITALEKIKGPVPRASALKLIGQLRAAIALAPTLHWRYKILSSVLGVRRGLNLSGHRRLSGKVKLVIERWAAKIKADHTMPKLDHDALLRWIKGAAI